MSTHEKDVFDRSFAKKMKDYSVPVPPETWSEISSRMAYRSIRRRRKIYSSAIAAMILLLMASYWGMHYFAADFAAPGESFVQHIDGEQNNNVFNGLIKGLNEEQDTKGDELPESLTEKIDIKDSESAGSAEIGEKKEVLLKQRELPQNRSKEIYKREKQQILPLRFIVCASVNKDFPRNAKSSSPNMRMMAMTTTAYESIYGDLESKYTPTKVVERKWSVVGDFASLYSYRDAGVRGEVYASAADLSKDQFNDPTAQESHKNTFSAGMNVQYAMNNTWSIETGVYYTRLGQKKTAFIYENDRGYGRQELSTSAGRINADLLPFRYNSIDNDGVYGYLAEHNELLDLSLDQTFDYIEFPMLVSRKLWSTDLFDFRVKGGISTSLLVSNQAILFFQKEPTLFLGETQGYRNFLCSGVLGISIHVPVWKRFHFQIDPTFKYAFNSLNKDHNVYYRPFSAGVNAGVSVNF